MKGLKSKNKMVLLLSIFLVLVICVGAASAASDTNIDDNSSQGNVLTSTDDVDVVASADASSIGSSADKEIVGTGESKNFTDLNNEINGKTDSVIYLEGNYKFSADDDADYKNGIVITRDVVIDGQGTTVIDGSNLARAFYIAEGVSSFTLMNVKVQNTRADKGAVVYVYNPMDGLSSKDFNSLTISGEFTNNTATSGGGVVYVCSNIKNAIFDGNFTDNAATNGGVVRFNDVSGSVIFNGNYINNTADGNAGVAGFNGAVSGSVDFDATFTGNSANVGGVAYFAVAVSGHVRFDGNYNTNSAKYGDVAYFNGGKVTVEGSYDVESSENLFITTDKSNFDGSKANLVKMITTLDAVYPTTIITNSFNIIVNLTGLSNYDGAKVKVNISGTPYTIDLNSDGQGSTTITDVPVGLNEITIYYEGSEDYLSVKKIDTVNRLDNVKTFTDLNNEINKIIPLEVVKLSGNYFYNEESDSKFVDGIRISRNIVIDGCGYIIDGAGIAKLFDVESGVSEFKLVNVTVQNTKQVAYFNGAMNNVVFDGTFTSNSATGDGGVAYFAGAVSNVVFDGTFTSNSATGHGGVAYFAVAVSGNVTFDGDYTQNTLATEKKYGGVAYFKDVSGSVVLSGDFKENSAYSAGVAHFGGAVSGNVTLSGTFTNNKGTMDYGAGVVNFGAVDSSANIILSGNFKENSASSSYNNAGGGVVRFGSTVSGNVTFNGTFTNNNAGFSGGVAIFYSAVSGSVVLNGTFTGNSATGNGGVAYFTSIAGDSVTFDGNYIGNIPENSIIATYYKDKIVLLPTCDLTQENIYDLNKVTKTEITYPSKRFINIPFNVHIKVSGLSGVESNVTLTNGSTVRIIPLDSNGEADVEFCYDTPGIYTITATFEGNGIYSSKDSKDIAVRNVEVKTFTDLNNLINTGTMGDVITLDAVYVYNSVDDTAFKDGIPITRDITIDGNDFLIDGNDVARLFTIDSSVKEFKLVNVTVKNVARAVYFNGDVDNVVLNGTFESNSAYTGAVAYFASTVSGNVTFNGTFNDNSGTANGATATGGGVAYFAGAVSGNVTFAGNYTKNTVLDSSKKYGGVAYFAGAVSGSVVLSGDFKENSAYSAGVAHFGGAVSGNVTLSGTFTNNKGTKDYGAGVVNFGAVNSGANIF